MGDTIKFIFSLQIFDSFSTFSSGVENTYTVVNFLANCLSNFKLFCCGLRSRYSRSITKCGAWIEVGTQLSFHFPGEKCVTWKNRENVDYLWHHSTIKYSPKWSHCVWSSNSCNRLLFLTQYISKKKFQCQISLTVIDDKKIRRVNILHHHSQWPSSLIQNILLQFWPFPGGKFVAWNKVKTLNISDTIQLIFFIFFTPCV